MMSSTNLELVNNIKLKRRGFNTNTLQESQTLNNNIIENDIPVISAIQNTTENLEIVNTSNKEKKSYKLEIINNLIEDKREINEHHLSLLNNISVHNRQFCDSVLYGIESNSSIIRRILFLNNNISNFYNNSRELSNNLNSDFIENLEMINRYPNNSISFIIFGALIGLLGGVGLILLIRNYLIRPNIVNTNSITTNVINYISNTTFGTYFCGSLIFATSLWGLKHLLKK